MKYSYKSTIEIKLFLNNVNRWAEKYITFLNRKICLMHKENNIAIECVCKNYFRKVQKSSNTYENISWDLSGLTHCKENFKRVFRIRCDNASMEMAISSLSNVIIAWLRRKYILMLLQQDQSIQRGVANNLAGELILLQCYPLLFLMIHHCSP